MTTRNPKQTRSLQKYEDVLNTTIRIINEGRFHTTSTHTIAKEAKVGIGTVYDYFKSKEDILLAALEMESNRIWEKIESEENRLKEVDPLEFIKLLFPLMINHAFDNSGFVKVVFGYIPGVMEHDLITANLQKLQNLFRELLIKGNSSLSVGDYDSKSFLLVNMLIGIMLGVAHGVPLSLKRKGIITELDIVLNQIIYSDD